MKMFNRELQFYDYHLKGIKNGLDLEDPVQLFYMGINKWRSEKDYRIPGTQYKNLYLTSNGNANSVRGDGVLSFEAPKKAASDKYTYDPKTPIMTLGRK